MPGRDIVVVGASAGGVEAMVRLVAGLPAGFPGALFFVLHLPAQAPSALPAILSRSGPLAATHAVDGEPVRPGHIYVAPPDHHLIVDRDAVRLGRGPRENRHRPSVDVLFRSAAVHAGRNALAVIMTGMGDDGARGLKELHEAGGRTYAQDEESCVVFGMPKEAIKLGGVDQMVSLDEIPAVLLSWR
jgi:two-component system chemotaxis response regulator CheB